MRILGKLSQRSVPEIRMHQRKLGSQCSCIHYKQKKKEKKVSYIWFNISNDKDKGLRWSLFFAFSSSIPSRTKQKP